jgi:periplasmic protein TonB
MPSTGDWRSAGTDTAVTTVATEPLPAPPRLTRRRADRGEGRLSRDRLTTMLVLAGLLHGLIILGLTFTAPGGQSDSVDRGLEVLLVSDELPEARDNDSATYLSQRTQKGSGNTRERLPAQLPSAAQAEAGTAGADAHRAESLEEQVLATRAQSWSQVQFLPPPATEQMSAAVRVEAQRAGDEALRLRGEARDELYITADTRASKLAPYLDGWRRRVERVGTMNYPTAARLRELTSNPVVEVTLQRDGKLRLARIQRSSGQAEIDAAALNILRLASPFDPFPPELAREYRSLRFAYEWQFVGNTPGRGAVTVP